MEIAFDVMVRQRLLPPAPQKMKGVEWHVEYISIMAQAQKMVGLGGVQQLFQMIQQIASVDPGILDKIDMDELVTVYADLLGVPPKILESEEVVAKLRKIKADAQQDQQKAQNMEQMASSAKQLSMADMNGNNALTKLLGSLQNGAPNAAQVGAQ